MGTADLAKEVLAREEEMNQAVSGRDRAALEAILADDLRYIHSGGLTQDKAAFIAAAMERGNRGDLSNAEVFITGATAIMFGDRGDNRVMKVWAKVDGAWRLAARQAMFPSSH